MGSFAKEKIFITLLIMVLALSSLWSYGQSIIKGQWQEEPAEIVFEERKIYVHIAGQVQTPGVYQISPQDRLFHLVELAGGATEKADLDAINLASLLEDGQRVYIPEIGEIVEKGDGRININTASQAELESLPGIGPALAQRIIDYRARYGSFRTVEELTKVSGIGEKTLENLREYISVGP